MKTAPAFFFAAALVSALPLALFAEDRTLSFPVPTPNAAHPPPKFPWPWPAFSITAPAGSEEAPLSFLDSLGNLTDSNGRPEPSRSHQGNRLIGLYFTAWKCGPCREFSPVLHKATRSGAPIKIVVVSRDYTVEDFKELCRQTPSSPWAMVPYESEARKALFERYGVRGVPALLIFTADGELVEKNGRTLVRDKGTQGLRQLALDARRNSANNNSQKTAF